VLSRRHPVGKPERGQRIYGTNMTIPVEKASIQRLLEVLQTPCNADDTDNLTKPTDAAELHEAFRPRRRRRVTGCGGIVREYYMLKWEVISGDMCYIFNEMFWEHCTTPKQKHAVIICPPKVPGGLSLRNCRPITLLNTDYKCLARVIGRRLQPVIEKHLTGTQYCEVPGASILDAVATIRDTTAYKEYKNRTMCLLSLDF